MIRVVVATQNAPVYLGTFVKDFLDLVELDPRIQVQGFLVLPPLFHKSAWLEAKARWNLYGWRDFLLMCGHIACAGMLDLLWRCGFKKASPRLFTLLKSRQIPQLPFADINAREFQDYLQNQAEVLVSIACPRILSQAVLESASLGALNYHTGALPKYRGRQPLYWALLNGEKEIGVTVHEMAPQLDAGPIVVQKMVDIRGVKSLHECYRRSLKVGPGLLVQALQKLLDGDSTRLANPDLGEKPYRFPTKVHGQAFRRKGLRVY